MSPIQLSKQSRQSFLSLVAAVVVTAVATWKIQKKCQKMEAEQRRAKEEKFRSLGARLAAEMEEGKVVDLRDEASFAEERIRGSHNIPLDSLWNDNRWYELPEQHEKLLVLLPPSNADSHAGLAKEFCDRRASGATSFLTISEDLFAAAQDDGMVESGPPIKEGAEPSWKPLFTPSPFLTRAVASLEPRLGHACLPLTCIDIGCGAGRDVVWLAKRGWAVVALDCWGQALQKTAELARRMGVAKSVEVRKGEVRKTGELIVHAGCPLSGANGGSCGIAESTTSSFSSSSPFSGGVHPNTYSNGNIDKAGVVLPLGSELNEVYSLVVAIRFLERKAFDTLANLVDPRGGYIILSTFVEENQLHQQNSSRALGPSTGKSVHSVRAGGIGGNKNTGGIGGYSGRDIQNGGDSLSEKVDARIGLENSSHEGANAGERSGGGNGVNSRGGERGATGIGSNGGRKKMSMKKGAKAAAAAAAEAAAIMARWPHKTPKDASKILRRGELAQVFGGRYGFEILEDSTERLPDGRPISCFLARRSPLVVSSPSSNGSSIVSPCLTSPFHRSQPRTRLQDPGSRYRSPAKEFSYFFAGASLEWDDTASDADTSEGDAGDGFIRGGDSSGSSKG